jgi:hypothetical protein
MISYVISSYLCDRARTRESLPAPDRRDHVCRVSSKHLCLCRPGMFSRLYGPRGGAHTNRGIPDRSPTSCRLHHRSRLRACTVAAGRCGTPRRSGVPPQVGLCRYPLTCTARDPNEAGSPPDPVSLGWFASGRIQRREQPSGNPPLGCGGLDAMAQIPFPTFDKNEL